MGFFNKYNLHTVLGRDRRGRDIEGGTIKRDRRPRRRLRRTARASTRVAGAATATTRARRGRGVEKNICDRARSGAGAGAVERDAGVRICERVVSDARRGRGTMGGRKRAEAPTGGGGEDDARPSSSRRRIGGDGGAETAQEELLKVRRGEATTRGTRRRDVSGRSSCDACGRCGGFADTNVC